MPNTRSARKTSASSVPNLVSSPPPSARRLHPRPAQRRRGGVHAPGDGTHALQAGGGAPGARGRSPGGPRELVLHAGAGARRAERRGRHPLHPPARGRGTCGRAAPWPAVRPWRLRGSSAPAEDGALLADNPDALAVSVRGCSPASGRTRVARGSSPSRRGQGYPAGATSSLRIHWPFSHFSKVHSGRRQQALCLPGGAAYHENLSRAAAQALTAKVRGPAASLRRCSSPAQPGQGPVAVVDRHLRGCTPSAGLPALRHGA